MMTSVPSSGSPPDLPVARRLQGWLYAEFCPRRIGSSQRTPCLLSQSPHLAIDLPHEEPLPQLGADLGRREQYRQDDDEVIDYFKW